MIRAVDKQLNFSLGHKWVPNLRHSLDLDKKLCRTWGLMVPREEGECSPR